MKHNVRFWKKRFGVSKQHQDDIRRALLTQLVTHEQINTTVAKAKFLKHEMESLINSAKRGTNDAWELARNSLFSHEKTVPKLMKVLSARYSDRKGGYVRIIRNGYNAPGSDRAPKAIIELVNNPKDLVHATARLHGETIAKKLQEVEDVKYRREKVTLHDPATGEPVRVFKLADRGDLSPFDHRRLTRREVAIHKRLIQLRTSLRTFDDARQNDERTQPLTALHTFDELQRRLQKEVHAVNRKGRLPSPKFRERASLLGFDIVDSVVVPKPGFESKMSAEVMAATSTVVSAPVPRDAMDGSVTAASTSSDSTQSVLNAPDASTTASAQTSAAESTSDAPSQDADEGYFSKLFKKLGSGVFGSSKGKSSDKDNSAGNA